MTGVQKNCFTTKKLVNSYSNLRMTPSTTKSNSDDDFLIERLAVLVEAIAKTFGSRCEVVLHDLRKLDRSIVKIEHEHITGRKVGGSLTDLALRHIRENMTNDL